MSPAEKKGNNKVGLEDIVRGLTSVAESDVEKKGDEKYSTMHEVLLKIWT